MRRLNNEVNEIQAHAQREIEQTLDLGQGLPLTGDIVHIKIAGKEGAYAMSGTG
jgi:hypothetical protein